MATAKEVAAWMQKELERVNQLYQETVVDQIKHKFGEEFTHMNDSGNLAIDKKVLAEFRQLTGTTVIWEKGEKMWRKRGKFDEPGKRLQD